MAAASAAAVVLLLLPITSTARSRQTRQPVAARELVLVPPLTAEPTGETKPAVPPRFVIPGTPPDSQAPAPNRLRPNLIVVWFGRLGTPAADVPPDSPPRVGVGTDDLRRFGEAID